MKIIGVLALAVWCSVSCISTALAGPGSWDQTYTATVSGGSVYAMALQANGELIIGGAFSSVDGSSSRFHLARLFSDGSLDSTFFSSGSGLSSTVWTLAVESDGRILIGGDFTSINGTTRTRVGRLNSNGAVDGSFTPTNTINSTVLALAVQTNNAVVIGGNFSGGAFPSWNARLNADGTTDTSFASFPNGSVDAIAIQPDGRILIGGTFTTVNGATRNRIARLNADGSLDNTFQNSMIGASSTVRCIQVQTDGKILIGGDFTSVNNTPRFYVARLNTDGSLDSGFNANPGANGSVYTLVEQANNSVVIGGSFSTYSSASLSRVARLYPDSSRDTTFTNYGINNTVQSLAIQADGRILIGGLFTTINNTNWPYLGRLYGDLYPPQFISQPASLGTNVGANVTFSAQVNNPTSTSFQWLKNGNQISGATDTAYTIYNAQFSDAGNYSVSVSDAIGAITSSNAVLQVGIVPSFTSEAGSLTVAQGQSAGFNVTAAGTPLNYYWKKNGIFIAGQTNSSLNFASTVPANAATYTCQVSNFLGSITSTGAVLTVIYPPSISVQPFSQTVGVGSNFTVSVTAAGYPAVSYQWRTNGSSITGANASSYVVTEAQTNNTGGYDVIITNLAGSITSSIANVSVIYYPPTIGIQPVGGNILVGTNFTLSATAYGTAPLALQWRTNGTPIPGATANNYFINSARLSDAGLYDLVVTNSNGSITSTIAAVNVGYAPVIFQQPSSITNFAGGTAGFACIVTGTVPVNLQWTLDGNTMPGDTNSTLTITNLQPDNIGYYALEATNIFGSAVSSNASLDLAGYDFGSWNGLVAYYPFNGNANDATGYGNNGTIIGATLIQDRFGNPNAAYSFNGISNFITVPDFPQAGANAHTLSFWINANSWTNLSAPTAYVDIFDKDDGSSGVRQWACQGLQTGQIRSAVFTSTGEYDLDTISQLQTNQWYQVVTVWDGTNEYVFVNGLLDSGIPASGTLLQGNAPVRIGGNPVDDQQFFDGDLDEVRIYNRALSSNEVATLYALEADLPVIVQQPEAQTANAGSSVAFSVAATASNSLTYQWQMNGFPIAGATNTILGLTNIQTDNVAFYSVAVSNGLDGVVSSNARLSLNGLADPTWTGLMAYLPFNGNANDVTGNGNNGTDNGAVLTADRFGNPNSAYSFNGSGAYLDFGSPADLALTNNFTITAWCLFNGGTQNPRVISYGQDAGFEIITGGTGTSRMFQFYCGGPLISSTATYSQNVWNAVAVVVQNGTAYLYVNGALAATGPIAVPAFPYDLQIGTKSQAGSDFWGGSIDDVRIYNQALSSNNIAYLYLEESQTAVLPQQSLSANYVPGTGFNLNLLGIPNRNYILQTTTNLVPPVQWTPIWTNDSDTNGIWLFQDTNAGSPQKFYRVLAP